MTTIENLGTELTTKMKTLKFPRNSAGHKMTSKVPTAETNQTVSEVRSMIFGNLNNFETINYVYIVTKNKTLSGVISIKELFQQKPNAVIGKIAQKEIIKVHPETKQEKVTRLALDANIKAIPIVDKQNKFLGVVPSDQILTILDQEFHKDILRFAGVIPSSDKYKGALESSIWISFLRRLPWIILGLLGGFFAAEVIKSYESVLSKNLVLASFIPLVAYIANAVGTQTQTLYIRELVTHPNQNITKYILRQLVISLLIAFASTFIVIIVANILGHSLYLGLVVGLAILSAILTATFFALIIPYILSKTDIDPAVGSGPFATIVQDLLSIMIYFAISNFFF